MKVICVNQDSKQLKNLKREVRIIVPDAKIALCKCPQDAVKRAQGRGCDVLLTETDFPGMDTDGFELARQMQEINPRVNIIYITKSPDLDSAYKAFQVFASGYLVLPYEPARLADKFANLRFPIV
ncbi:MAG: response regulator [Oscillibacter sp.]|nr:response regulator [Oscillibacter sp.]